MAESTACGNCGEIINEPASIPVEMRKPCTKCGSMSRSFNVGITESVTASDTFTATITTYPSKLLMIAQDLINQGHYNIAIVTSHMASEVATERAFDAEYAVKKLELLGEAVGELMNGKSLGNVKHQKLYNALTGIKLEGQPFWNRFKKASEKRNAIVHKGGHADMTEAQAAIQAASELIIYLKQV